MKAKAAPAAAEPDEPADQLWNLQAATPLFGTSYEALLTTPLKTELTSMESMTVPSRQPAVRRWLPRVLAIAAGSALLAGGAWWAFAPAEAELRPSEAVAAIAPAEAPGAAPEATPAAPPPAAPEPAAAKDEPANAEAAADEASEAPSEAGEPAAAEEQKAAAKPPASTRRTPARRATPRRAPKAPFNTDKARAALQSAAAKASSACKGVSGKGKVQLTFAPSGKVSSAQLVSGSFAGTAAGSCVLRHFRAARVPAFSGSSKTVAKSFTIR